ncbi:AMP-binding protein, partial [Corynebacterium stationis]
MSDPLATIPDQYLLQDKAPAPRTLWDVVRASAAQYPEAAAIDDGEILTYAELIQDVEAWAADLRQHGVMRGDHIGIRMSSGQRDLYLA